MKSPIYNYYEMLIYMDKQIKWTRLLLKVSEPGVRGPRGLANMLIRGPRTHLLEVNEINIDPTDAATVSRERVAYE